MLRSLVAAVALLVLCCPLKLQAEETPTGKSVADLIKQLDAESFADRQAASEDLAKRGKEAIPALAAAAKSENAEAAARSLEIIRKHHEGSDAALQTAAKEALEKLAGGEGAVARRATELLKPKPANPQGVQPAVPGGAGIRIFGAGGGAIRIAVAAVDGGGKKVSVKDVDGVKEIEVTEKDRVIKINDDPAKGIKVKVTTKKDGKEESQEYEAKDASELKEKHPEAHKLYEQHKGGIAEIRVGAVPLAPGFAPVPVPVVPAPILRRLGLDAKDVTERLDKVQQQLGDAVARLKKLGENVDNSAEIKQAVEALEQSKKELEELRAKLPAP